MHLMYFTDQPMPAYPEPFEADAPVSSRLLAPPRIPEAVRA